MKLKKNYVVSVTGRDTASPAGSSRDQGAGSPATPSQNERAVEAVQANAATIGYDESKLQQPFEAAAKGGRSNVGDPASGAQSGVSKHENALPARKSST